MIDVAEASARRGDATTIEKNLDRQIKKGTLAGGGSATRSSAASRRARRCDAVRGAALVVEAATENRDLKFQIFADLDRHGRRGRGARDEHELDLDHRDRRRARSAPSA